MENLDIFYEAFENYKKKTVLDVDTTRFKKFYSSFKGEKYEDIVLTFSTCTIETDWVDAIEKGLPFIEKAIKEERQFIRNDGEVLPIEKIRKVSKDSIQDLAKHSNYITHEPDIAGDGMLIPDKLLMIRKESDFAIYENRVIYAALVYLRDFVSSRLNKIKELTNRYESEMFATKHLDLGNRKLEYSLHLHELRNNDPIVSSKNTAYDIIRRLDDIMSNIIALLKRPLMVEVSRVEMVSRPITKTNILKMNHNFRESLACFDYIANYSSDGYTVKTMKRHFNPYSMDMMEDFGEIAMLVSYLTYVHSNNLTGDLRKNYLALLEKRRLEEEERVLQKLKSLKARAKDEEKTLAEYFILFETGYRILEKKVENFERELKAIELKHFDEMQAQKDHYLAELDNQREYYDGELVKQENEFTSQIEQIKKDYENLISTLKQKQLDEISSFKERITNEKNESIRNKQSEIDQLNEKISNLTAELASFKEENKLLKVKINGLLVKTGQAEPAEEMITEEKFDELEKTKIAFDNYYKLAWKKAKEAIRKEALAIRKKKDK